MAVLLGGSDGQKILNGAVTRFPDKFQEPAKKIQAFLDKRRAATMKKNMEKKREKEKEIDESESKKKPKKKKKKRPISSNNTYV